MADKVQILVLDALVRASAEPSGLPLLGGRSSGALFATSALGKQAAQESKDQGLVRVVRAQAKGKAAQEFYTLSEKGLALLLAESSPRPVLEALVNVLEARQRQLAQLLDSAQACQEDLRALKERATQVLENLRQPAPPPAPASERNGKHGDDGAAPLLTYLQRRQDAGALDDCALPELYRHLQTQRPGLTMGQFHDLLTSLRAGGALYLHPWTGPLYELPEPACALLAGHEIAYYASLRRPVSPDS